MILRPLAETYVQSQDMKSFRERRDDPVIEIEGLAPSSRSIIIASLFLDRPGQYLVVTEGSQTLSDLALDLSCYLSDEELFTLPPWETLPYEYVSAPEAIERERIPSLYRLLSGEQGVFLTTVEAMIRKVPSPASLKGKGIILERGEEIPFQDLIKDLVNYGYQREQRVEVFGQFAVKGGIIDLFLPSLPNPLRLDFFGDTLESIREFDAVTQISMERHEKVTVYPRREILLSEHEMEKLRKDLAPHINPETELPDWLSDPEGEHEIRGIEDLFPAAIPADVLARYCREDAILVQIDPPELTGRLDALQKTFAELRAKRMRSCVTLPVEDLLAPEGLTPVEMRRVEVQSYTTSPHSLRWKMKSMPGFQGRVRQVREEMEKRLQEGWRLIMTTAFEGQARRLRDLFRELKPGSTFEELQERPFDVVMAPLREGCVIEDIRTMILTDHEIFGKSYRKRRAFKKRSSRPIESFLELKEGDYIVHVNHGIGIFDAIERMSAGGVERDFLKIHFQGEDKLYVPLDQITLVQKYIGLEGKQPRLDSLGKKSAWNKIKNRVQESVEKIAEELVEIYSRRNALKGFSYPPDTRWQEEFESRFEYEETPDQLTAIEDVKDDMESEKPMDRLVCGDVGFGKTEVAIRASFKAVMAGKQVAILVPTTILCMQHFSTFSRRFEGYPIEIEMISRFRSGAEIRKIRDRLAKGEIDIIIGTHALLNEEMNIRNLGLLVIDEEQKFGVRHKEKLKKFRTLVDVLTLSATPIPRTLHMSMAGIRELSIIATPPENRQSIETYVMEDNPDIMRRAILKEIDRGGQIFFVHNRVQTIDVQASILEKMVPEATYAVAHGQMREDDLEEIIIAFLKGEYDILLSTTIIESGLDMPNVNTMIISRADTFGLSQLYQLKGRIGRSERKSYAYLFYPPHSVLSEEAQKRLQVISEYSDLGSGFRIAMKDLEIRGAGNIIGHEQSGNIMDVGFDLYTQMLEDAVKRIKGEEVSDHFRTPVFIHLDFYIPDEYIADHSQKIEFYKRFESCEETEEVEELYSEMVDRFGQPPGIVHSLVEMERIRVVASRLRIDEIREDSRQIRIRLSSQSRVNIHNVVEAVSREQRLTFDPQDRDTLRWSTRNLGPEKKLHSLKKLLKQF